MKNANAVAELRVFADILESQAQECVQYIDVNMTVEDGVTKHHLVVAFTEVSSMEKRPAGLPE